MPLNKQWITEGIEEQTKLYLEKNENENIVIQNLWDAPKAVLRGKFIAIQAYLRKQEKSQINNLTLHLKHREKEQKKKKLEAMISGGHRCKNPQQNTNKTNPAIH